MSTVQQKLKNTKLTQKCQIIRQMEKEMTNKEAPEKFGVLCLSLFFTWMKNKDKLLESLKQSSSNANKMQGCDYEQVDKVFLNGFLFKETKTFRLMPQYSKKRHFNLQKF